MPIPVSCTNCEKKLKVADTAAGKSVRCPGCQTLLKVGAVPLPAAAIPKPAASRGAPSPRPPAPPPPPAEPEPSPLPEMDEPPPLDALADLEPHGRLGAPRAIAHVEPRGGGGEIGLKPTATKAPAPAGPAPGWGAFQFGVQILMFSVLAGAVGAVLMLAGSMAIINGAGDGMGLFGDCMKYLEFSGMGSVFLGLVGSLLCIVCPRPAVRYLALGAAILDGVVGFLIYQSKTSLTKPEASIFWMQTGAGFFADLCKISLMLPAALTFRNRRLAGWVQYNIAAYVVISAGATYVLTQLFGLMNRPNRADLLFVAYLLAILGAASLAYSIWTCLLFRRTAAVVAGPVAAEAAPAYPVGGADAPADARRE